MSVLIKGMEMPKSCDECRIMVFEDTNCAPELFCGCPIVFKAHSQGVGHRPDYCPLVPVPPHYDLIDHNALKIAVMNCDCETRVDFLKHTMGCINKAPVVIPSDMPTYEGEEGE